MKFKKYRGSQSRKRSLVGQRRKADFVVAKTKAGRLGQALRLVKKKNQAQFSLGVSMLLEFPAVAFKQFSRLARSKLAFRRAAGVFGLGSLERFREPELVLKAFEDKEKAVREAAYSSASRMVVEEIEPETRARLLQAILESEFYDEDMHSSLKKRILTSLAIVEGVLKKKRPK